MEFQTKSILLARNLRARIISTNTQTQYAHSTLQNCLDQKNVDGVFIKSVSEFPLSP